FRHSKGSLFRAHRPDGCGTAISVPPNSRRRRFMASDRAASRKYTQRRGEAMFSNTFPDRAVAAEIVAKMLLEIGAVHIRADEPYTFTSGLASPVYTDCRKLISFPRIRSAIMDLGTSIVLRDAGFEQFDVVAGGETAGIPFAAWMS